MICAEVTGYFKEKMEGRVGNGRHLRRVKNYKKQKMGWTRVKPSGFAKLGLSPPTDAGSRVLSSGVAATGTSMGSLEFSQKSL